MSGGDYQRDTPDGGGDSGSSDADGSNDNGTDDTHGTDDAHAVRVRGIYATALTRAFRGACGLYVVGASPPIERRFDAAFPAGPADAAVETTDDRQGIAVTGRGAAVERAVELSRTAGRDALSWRDSTPRGAVFAGEVVETPPSGAVVDLGDGKGFLPYSKTSRHVETGDRLRVQVTEPSPPWTDARPVLDTTVRVYGTLGSLVRGGTPGDGPEIADLLPADPPAGWAVDWNAAADDADLDALDAALDALSDRAAALDAAITGDVPAPDEAAPGRYWDGETTAWVWFGRESRFGLDARRREVTATMAGHHRIKAATPAASAAVDLVEAVCPDALNGDGCFGDERDGPDFPFDAVTRQFGPEEGDTVCLEHGKPDGRRITLGDAEVSRREADGTIVVRREMSPGGSYDGLGVERRAGDVAVTKLTEGKWWYSTVYRGEDGERRGTYVNVCTPVELFPSAVRYVDLHVDVVKGADGTVERLDDDELDAAVDAGHVPDALAEKARSVASALEAAL